ncbi:MAG: hypothetical protein HYY17_08380 [Planctomycetes bacterium]|nr:hypothetical protein [Planctomycetota bacterium]
MARNRKESIGIGNRLPANLLAEQAKYTLALAREDLARLQRYGVTRETITRGEELKERIEALLEDRSVADQESKDATGGQNAASAVAKSWLRRAILIGQMAFDDDPKKVEAFVKGPKIGLSVSKLAGKMKAVLALLKPGAAKVSKFGGDAAFVKQGKELLAALEEADAAQETGRTKLPKATEDFYVAKAELYFVLKQINRAGYAVYVDDRVSAGRYNLAILHRRAPARAEARPEPQKAEVSVN